MKEVGTSGDKRERESLMKRMSGEGERDKRERKGG